MLRGDLEGCDEGWEAQQEGDLYTHTTDAASVSAEMNTTLL